MQQSLESIRELIKNIDIETKLISDDFDFWLLRDLKTFAGKTLYQLTRGEEGIMNRLKLELKEVK